MPRIVAATGYTIAWLLSLFACSQQSDGNRGVRVASSSGTSTAVVDTRQSARTTRALPVTLPVFASTPVGIRIDTVTIWLDSTRIGPAVSALGPKSALGRYDPGGNLLVACYHTRSAGETYVLLKAGFVDTARIVQVFVARKPETIDPALRCTALPNPSATVSNTLGLRLGMTWLEVENLLGKSGDTTRFPEMQYAQYVMGRIPDDTSDAGEERAAHANVTTDLQFERDTLIMIRIRRGRAVPRYVE